MGLSIEDEAYQAIGDAVDDPRLLDVTSELMNSLGHLENAELCAVLARSIACLTTIKGLDGEYPSLESILFLIGMMAGRISQLGIGIAMEEPEVRAH